MKKFTLITVMILLILFSGIGIVSAETITGTVGTTGFNSTSYTMIYQATGGAKPAAISNLFIHDIQYTAGVKYLIRYDIVVIPTFTVGSPTGNNTVVNFSIGATPIGTGSFGYQRAYNPDETETFGYQYLIFNDDWIGFSSFTGDQTVTITGIPINGINYDILAYNASVPSLSGGMKFGTSGNGWFGNYSVQKDLTFNNDYSATKPSGIGITGYISKLSGGSIYPSRAWVFDGSTNALLTSETTLTSNQFNFSTGAQTIKIGIQDSLNLWYNTSVLFSPGYGTPTPTPTPTQPIGPDNPIPSGYTRTMAQCVDGQTSGSIHDCHLDLYDIENTSWSNGSYLDMGSYYGTWWIDTLPGHTINAYAESTGYTPVSRLNLPASSTHMYELILWPTSIPAAGSGFVNLYVLVHDVDSGNAITGAAVQVRILDGTTYAQTTGTSGSRMFEVPNSSYTSITVSKYGYVTGTRGITTSISGDDTVRIELLKKVVTAVPTSTIPPGGVTTAVTMDPRSSSEKDRDMMDQIRTAGPILIQLAIVATVLGLLGLMMKSVK